MYIKVHFTVFNGPQTSANFYGLISVQINKMLVWTKDYTQVVQKKSFGHTVRGLKKQKQNWSWGRRDGILSFLFQSPANHGHLSSSIVFTSIQLWWTIWPKSDIICISSVYTETVYTVFGWFYIASYVF